MRIFLVLLAALTPLPGLAPAAHAHIGDQIYPFFELLDEDLHRIDLTDGSIEDWHDVLGEASLTAADFYYPYSQYDPGDCDFRFWFGWHRRSGTLWVAMERFDDIYHNNYAGEIFEWGFPIVFRPAMILWDSYFSFMIDGDHSRGPAVREPYAAAGGGVFGATPATTVTELDALRSADLFADGLLVGAGEDPSRYDDVSAVAPSSWGRIKASFK